MGWEIRKARAICFVLAGLVSVSCGTDDDEGPAPRLGICCVTGGTCTLDSTLEKCSEFGAFVDNPDALCSDNLCDGEGACCQANGCTQVSQASECMAGIFHAGMTCSEVSCSNFAGGCCIIDRSRSGDEAYTCEMESTQGDCEAQASARDGIEVTFTRGSEGCDDCPPQTDPTGVCCSPTGCVLEFNDGLTCVGDYNPDLTSCDPDPCEGSGGNVVREGVREVPSPFTAPDGLDVMDAAWAMSTAGQFPVIIGADGGTFVVDAKTNRVLYQSSSADTFGVLGFSTNPDVLLRLFQTGSAFSSGWADGATEWDFTVPNTLGYSDATTIGGGNMTDGYTAVAPTIKYIVVFRWDPVGLTFANDFFELEQTAIQMAEPEQRPISAYAHQKEGPLVFVTDGAPGRLFVHDMVDANAAPTLIGNVGSGPRQLRCVPPVCAVAIFGDDADDPGIRLFSWDGTSTTVTLRSKVEAGTSPIGIDMVMNGSTVDIVSTGTDDDTYTITKVASDGSVVSNQTTALPDGCEGAANAAWLRDDEGLKVVVTCTDTDNYAVINPN